MAQGRVVAVSAYDLRRARRAGSLKWRVRREIADWLDKAGVLRWPHRIPENQDQQMLLFAPDSDPGALMALAFKYADRDRSAQDDASAA